MILWQIACTTEKMIVKETSALVAESLEDILEFAYDNARSGVRSVIYNVHDQFQLNLLR